MFGWIQIDTVASQSSRQSVAGKRHIFKLQLLNDDPDRLAWKLKIHQDELNRVHISDGEMCKYLTESMYFIDSKPQRVNPLQIRVADKLTEEQQLQWRYKEPIHWRRVDIWPKRVRSMIWYW